MGFGSGIRPMGSERREWYIDLFPFIAPGNRSGGIGDKALSIDVFHHHSEEMVAFIAIHPVMDFDRLPINRFQRVHVESSDPCFTFEGYNPT